MMADNKSMKMIVDYYTWVRKCNVSVFFLAQHNTDVSRIIRSNLTYAVIFYTDSVKEANIIAADYASSLSKLTFRTMLRAVTAPSADRTDANDCLVIQCNQTDEKLKFRQNFINKIDPDEYKAASDSE